MGVKPAPGERTSTHNSCAPERPDPEHPSRADSLLSFAGRRVVGYCPAPRGRPH